MGSRYTTAFIQRPRGGWCHSYLLHNSLLIDWKPFLGVQTDTLRKKWAGASYCRYSQKTAGGSREQTSSQVRWKTEWRQNNGVQEGRSRLGHVWGRRTVLLPQALHLPVTKEGIKVKWFPRVDCHSHIWNVNRGGKNREWRATSFPCLSSSLCSYVKPILWRARQQNPCLPIHSLPGCKRNSVSHSVEKKRKKKKDRHSL